jgi:hypothetical protein
MPRRALSDLWLSSEQWSQDASTPNDEIVDVKVTLDDGSAWVATLCAYDHVATLRARWAKSGESLGGRYLWASNLVLVDQTSRNAVQTIVEDLLRTGELFHAFAQTEPPLVSSDSARRRGT